MPIHACAATLLGVVAWAADDRVWWLAVVARGEHRGQLLGGHHAGPAAAAGVRGQVRAAREPARPPDQRALLAAGAELRPLGVHPAPPHRRPGRQIFRPLPPGRRRHRRARGRRSGAYPPDRRRDGYAGPSSDKSPRIPTARSCASPSSASGSRWPRASDPPTVDLIGELKVRSAAVAPLRSGAPPTARSRSPIGHGGLHHRRPLAPLHRGDQRLRGADQQPTL